MWIFKSFYVLHKSIVLKKYEPTLQDVFASQRGYEKRNENNMNDKYC